MTHKGTVTLETPRLLLRPFSPDDFDAFFSWRGSPEHMRYVREPLTAAETREYLRSRIERAQDAADYRHEFTVVLKETGAAIGSCGIYPENALLDTAGLGWILHKDHWNRGCGTELCAELLRFGFEDLHLRRIFATCAAVNYGSRRVMERNGMRREATKIKAFWAAVDKEWIDSVEYAILAEDYLKENRL